MSSRRRNRQRSQARQAAQQAAAATDAAPAQTPETDGDRGEEYPTIRPVAKLERAALIQRWPVPDHYRPALINRQVAIAIDPNTEPREATQAFRAVLAADQMNLDAEREPAPAAAVNVNVGVNVGVSLDDQTRAAALARLHAAVGRRSGDATTDGPASDGDRPALGLAHNDPDASGTDA